METAAPARAPADPEALIERVQELQDRIDSIADEPMRGLVDDLVGAIMQMYGAGLRRIVELVQGEDPAAEGLPGALSEDQLVATLLLIHDLYPVPLEQRVQAALDSVRPYMESHGGNVELLSLQDGVAHIHLQGSCSDCAASSVTLELAIKQALEDAAPDLESLEVEGVAPQLTGAPLPMAGGEAPAGIELPVVIAGQAPAAPAWFEVPAAAEVRVGALTAVAVAGAELAIANIEGTLLAYRDRCADCGSAIHDGELTDGALTCPSCQRAFFLPGAGRSLDGDHLQLEPIPLLREDGEVKVALAG